MNEKLPIVALSGGICTGKSTCIKIFKEIFSDAMQSFDADASTTRLYKNEKILESLTGHFGSEIVQEQGELDTARLRKRIFSNTRDKEFIEALFHPIIREECLAEIENVITNCPQTKIFIAEIPLLFETQFDIGQSSKLLVACTENTQAQRLKKRSAWPQNDIDSVLAAQMPIENKFALADVVFWNEGPINFLRAQCQRYMNSLEI